MPEKDLINTNLKMLKQLEGLTTEELASRMGNISKYNVDKYLKQTIPPPDVIRAVSKAFDLDMNQFFTRKLTISNYDDFRLSKRNQSQSTGHNTSGERDKVRALLDIILNDQSEPKERQMAAGELTSITEGLINEVEELHDMHSKLVEFLQSHKIIDKGVKSKY